MNEKTLTDVNDDIGVPELAYQDNPQGGTPAEAEIKAVAKEILVKQMKLLHQYSLECNAYDGLPQIASVLRDLIQLSLSL